jgi:UPF0716 protein FxsA
MLDDPGRANNLAPEQAALMSLLKWAIFGLLLLPFAEVVVFVAVAIKIGFLAAVALTILTSLAGAAMIRGAGSGAVARTRGAFGDGVVTAVELDGRGVLTVLAGFLLLVPGFLTDILGALLLLPITRSLLRSALQRATGRPDPRAAPPGVVDLAPDEWRHVPNDRIGHEPSSDSRS